MPSSGSAGHARRAHDYKFGDYFRLDARRKEVQGYEPGPYMHFWNVWLDKR